MKRIFITGESGLLAKGIAAGLPEGFKIINEELKEKYSFKYFWNDYHFYNGDKNKQVKEFEIDILNQTNITCVAEELDENDIIIHTAAYVNTDKCDNYSYDAIKSNILGTQNMITLSRLTGARLIYFSTTAVFDPNSYMQKNGYFDEEEIINPKTLYGLSKYCGELAVKQTLNNAVIIKPVFVYGNAPEDNSSNIRKIFQAVLEDKIIDITLENHFKKNYMRVENFSIMFNQILVNLDYFNNTIDFIISNPHSWAKSFGNICKDLTAICIVDVNKHIKIIDKSDYLQDHLGLHSNFIKYFNQKEVEKLYQRFIKNEEGFALTFNSVCNFNKNINKS